jgi:hypothetical protein
MQAILQTSDTTPFKEAEKLVFLSGNAYEGDRRGLTMHGQGLYSWKDDGAVFKGDFKNNMPAGRGQYVWADGSTYTGGVSRGQREGVGVFTAADVTVRLPLPSAPRTLSVDTKRHSWHMLTLAFGCRPTV